MIGSTISHYRILGELGRGGMGVVYRALDTRLGREVALKFLPDDVAHDGPELARFRREARAASALNHPNICTIYDIGEAEGRHYIAMELLRGVSLAQKLEAGPLPVEEVLRLGIQLAGALEAAHAQGVVHRDVKPGNIFVTDRGDAKLVDFGLAKAALAAPSGATAMTLEPDVTQPHRVVGTPSFMSPEQALARPIDGRSDLFSLGAVLYVMATGHRPFEASSLAAILDAVLHREPPPVATLREGAWDGVDRVIRRCLAKDPAQRYGDAGELREELDALAAATLSSRQAPAGSVGPSHRPGLVLVGVALAVIVAVAVGSRLWLSRDPSSASLTAASSPVIAVLPFSNQTGEEAKDYLGQALSAGLLTELAEIGALRLVSAGVLGPDRTAAAERALDLGTQLFVEGEVQELADRLRVQIRISDARSGLVLWSGSEEADSGDALAVHGRIARDVAAFLAIPLSRRESERLASDPTSSLEAWRLYAQAVRSLEEPTSGRSLDEAIESLTEAVRIDPEFALAHATLARALWIQHEETRDPAKLEAAIAAAERAVALDADLPEGQLVRALVASATGVPGTDIADAAARALARHPRPAAAHSDLAMIHERVGLDGDAERLLRRAVELENEDWFHWNRLGVFLFRRGKLDEARPALERAVALAPAAVTRPRENLAVLAVQESRLEEAFSILESLPESPLASFADIMATAFFFSNRPDKWEKAEHYYRLAIERAPSRAEYRGNLADLYARMGREDDALGLYRQAFALVDEKARAHPDDLDASLLAAMYAAKARDCSGALDRTARLEDLAADNAQRSHMIAIASSLCRDRSATLAAVERAIELGYPAEFMAREDEFGWLADDPELRALLDSRAPDSRPPSAP